MFIVFNTPKRGSTESIIRNQEITMKRNAELKVKELKKMLENKIPKIGTILMIGSTIPLLYFTYNLILEDYESKEFLLNIRCGIDWVNYSNIFFSSVYFGLEAIKFYDRRNTISKLRPPSNFYLMLIPIVFTLGSITFTDRLTKNAVYPSIAADLSVMAIETKATTVGLMPYWFFNIRYRLHIFIMLNLAIYYYALKGLNKDIAENPDKYKAVLDE